MSVALPHPIQCYFNAESLSPVEVAKCFTKDGVVQDEQNTYTGFDKIMQWNSEALIRYNYKSTPISVDVNQYRSIVLSSVSGKFPGSPLTLRYIFILSGNKISSLEITS